MPRFLAVLLLFSLFAPSLVLAVDSKDIGSASIDLDLRWNIAGEAPGKKVLKTFGYPNTTFQTTSVSSNTSFSVEKDAFGNDLLVFEWSESGPRTIQLKVNAQVDYDVHWEDADSADKTRFADATKLVQVDDSIATQAGILSQGASSDFEKLVRFTEWVHNAITYDDSFWLRQPTSPDIFVQRKGVCNQYSHLDMALLRAQNIPSRFVAGWVYSGKDWGPHAWTEVWINGKWVPADATYNEVDLLDGSHVVFAYGYDQADIKEELTRGLTMVKQQDIKFASFEKPREFFKIEVEAPDKVGSQASEKVGVKIENGDNKPHAIPVSISVPSEPKELEIKVVGDSSKLVFVPSLGSRQVEWDLLFPKLEKNFIYNFTIQVATLGMKEKISIAGEPTAREDVKKRVLLTTIESIQGLEEIAVIATLANPGNVESQASVSIAIGNQTQSQTILLAGGETRQARFTFSRPLPSASGLLTIDSDSSVSAHPFEIIEAREIIPVPQGLNAKSMALLAVGLLAVVGVLWFFSRKK